MPAEPSASDSVPAAAASRPRRRWLRYSLRTLLLVMLLFACAAAWVGHEIQKGRDQLTAAAWVREHRGTVTYEVPTELLWQHRWLGEWYPDPVAGIDLQDCDIESIDPLVPLRAALVLRLANTGVADLAPLKEFQRLLVLDVTGTPIPAEQLARLQIERPELILWRPPVNEEPPPLLEIVQRTVTLHSGSGEALWSVEVGAGRPITELRGRLSPSEEVIVIRSLLHLYALSREDGSLLWERRMNCRGFEVLDGLVLAVGNDASRNFTGLWGFGLDAATGEEKYSRELPWYEHIREFHGYFLFESTPSRVTGNLQCSLVDREGEILANFQERCLDVLPHEAGLICLLESGTVCVKGPVQIGWKRGPTSGQLLVSQGFLQELPGGDLLVVHGSVMGSDGVDIQRLDSTTGVLQGSHTYPERRGTLLGTQGSFQTLEVEVRGEYLLIFGRGMLPGIGGYLEILRLENFRPIYRGDFPGQPAAE